MISLAPPRKVRTWRDGLLRLKDAGQGAPWLTATGTRIHPTRSEYRPTQPIILCPNPTTPRELYIRSTLLEGSRFICQGLVPHNSISPNQQLLTDWNDVYVTSLYQAICDTKSVFRRRAFWTRLRTIPKFLGSVCISLFKKHPKHQVMNMALFFLDKGVGAAWWRGSRQLYFDTSKYITLLFICKNNTLQQDFCSINNVKIVTSKVKNFQSSLQLNISSRSQGSYFLWWDNY